MHTYLQFIITYTKVLLTCLSGAIIMHESYKIGAYHRTENENLSVDRHVKLEQSHKGSRVKIKYSCTFNPPRHGRTQLDVAVNRGLASPPIN